MTLLYVMCVCVNIYIVYGVPQISLEYNPRPSSFVGASGTNFVGQIIPPGKPWPSSPEGYANFSVLSKPNRPPTIVDRLPEINNTVSSTEATNPNRPSFAGSSGTDFVGQLIPPGKPWPANPADYQNFTDRPNLAERFPEVSKPSTQLQNPNIPSFAGSTGSNLVGQLIPPGKPWPSNTQGYQNFSILRPPPPRIVSDKSTDKPTRRPAFSFTNFEPLIHNTGISTTEPTVFTSIPHAPIERLPTTPRTEQQVVAVKPEKVTQVQNDNGAPFQSEIIGLKPANNGELNNLDFFKPQFQKQPETFLAPVGIGVNKGTVNNKPTTSTPIIHSPAPLEVQTTPQTPRPQPPKPTNPPSTLRPPTPTTTTQKIIRPNTTPNAPPLSTTQKTVRPNTTVKPRPPPTTQTIVRPNTTPKPRPPSTTKKPVRPITTPRPSTTTRKIIRPQTTTTQKPVSSTNPSPAPISPSNLLPMDAQSILNRNSLRVTDLLPPNVFGSIDIEIEEIPSNNEGLSYRDSDFQTQHINAPKRYIEPPPPPRHQHYGQNNDRIIAEIVILNGRKYHYNNNPWSSYHHRGYYRK